MMRVWLVVLVGLLAVPPVLAQESGGVTLSLERLGGMSRCELEWLYRQAEPGIITEGFAHGRAIYPPDAPLAGLRSKLTNTLWHGKIFRAGDCTLVNQWTGLQAIRARVSYGPSWFDGRPSIIMDYRTTADVWSDVRDEVREVAPGLFLGLMYRRRSPRPQFKMFFALRMPDCAGVRR
jgi:hypothetical protein